MGISHMVKLINHSLLITLIKLHLVTIFDQLYSHRHMSHPKLP